MHALCVYPIQLYGWAYVALFELSAHVLAIVQFCYSDVAARNIGILIPKEIRWVKVLSEHHLFFCVLNISKSLF